MCDQKNGDDVDELSASDDSEPEEGLSSAPFDPELDHDDEDEDDEGGGAALSAAAGLGAQSSFSLRGGGSAFSHRSSSIFQGLDSVARLSSSSSSSSSTTATSSSTTTTTTTSSTTSSDGVFARPRPPSRRPSAPPSSGPSPPKKRAGVPDYLVHPERWTHYSLEEVPETCERSNSRAALLYLSGLQQRKEEQQQQEEQEQEQEESRGDSSRDLQQKMIFSRVRAGGSGVSAADQPPAVRGREKETRLSHLEEQEEEQEEAAGRRTEQRKRGGAVEEELKQEDRGEEQQESPAFTSFRRTKQKNYRRSSAGEES